uniref:Uncharacterized protein n=1 Tax=Aegilops tauschii subsp. strangulata TaxID=200361 RepID=A0A452XFJ8_AEGTS
IIDRLREHLTHKRYLFNSSCHRCTFMGWLVSEVETIK